MNNRQSRLRALPILFAALSFSTLVLASCAAPFTSSSGTAGAVTVSVGADSTSSRTIVPSVVSQVAAITVSITDSKNDIHSTTVAAASATVGDIYPGACSIQVTAYADSLATVPLASGTASATVSSGATAAVSVPMTLITTTSAPGNLSLAVSFPANLGITALTAAFTDSAGTISVSGADYGAGTATLSGTGIAGGAHTLLVTFYRESVAFARVYESVNVHSGITSDRWIDSTGTMQTTRAYTASELYDSTAGLASLTVGGVTVGPLVTGTYAYTVTVGALDTLNFSLTGAMPGQTFAYSWNSGLASAASGSITGDSLSPGLTTVGSNTLTITVTASDGATKGVYTITVLRSWTVRFNLGGNGTKADTIAANGATLTEPTPAPTFTGYEFAGWYADAAFTTPWVFGGSGTQVTSNTTLYAKWTEFGNVAITIRGPNYQSFAFSQYGKTITSLSMDKDGTLTLEAPSGATSYQWYVKSAVQTETSSTFVFNPASRSINAGIYTLSVVAAYGSVSYSGNLAITVANGAMVTVIPFGDTATYHAIKMNGTSITSELYTSISPYAIAKTETNYALWAAVRDWAKAHGYSFGNQGNSGGNDYPVTDITWADMIVWCNAYTEMTTGATTNCCYTVAGSVLRDSTNAVTTGTNAVYDRSKSGYRLPTEAEWQYAASGREQVAYNQVSGCVGTNYSDYGIFGPAGGVIACATKLPNALGLRDMSGNAEEACADRYDSEADNVPAGTSAASPADNYCNTGSNSSMVYRGGSYGCTSSGVSIGYREYGSIGTQKGSMSFRIARTITN